MVRKIFLQTLLLVGFFYANGQDTIHFNLNQCIRYALENSYLITEHEIEKTESETSLKASKTEFLPRIDGYITYFQYLSDFPTYIFPESEGNILSGGTSGGPYPLGLGLPMNLQAGLTIDQVIFDKKFLIANDYSENLKKINDLKSDLSKEDIIYNVTITYYKLSSMRNSMQLVDYNLKRISRIERMLQSQIENGFAREVDKSRIMIQRSKILSGKEDLESGRLKLNNYLKFLMGMSIESSLVIIPEEISLSEEWQQLLDSMEIRSTQLELLSAQQDVNELRKSGSSADYFPRVSAFAHLQAQAQRDAFNFFSGGEDWFLINLLGVKMDIPIMNGGDKRRKMELAEVEASRIELNKYKLQESMQMQYKSSYNELLSCIKKARYAEENEATAANLYDNTEKLFAEGIVQLPDLLETEALHEEMQLERVKSYFDYKLAIVNYMQAAGTLLSYEDKLNQN